jgi:long-chain acyl-CoA synthetase
MKNEYTLKELSRYKIGTYADLIYRNALLHADREAFVYNDERVTFSQYNSRVNSLIAGLNTLGVKKGDVIGILSWNCLEYMDVMGAAMKGGFIASVFNPRLQSDELDYLINYSEANTLFVGPELVNMANSLRSRTPKVKNYISFEGPSPDMVCLRDMLTTYSSDEPDIVVEPDDPVTIIYTSGTTGVPRGALYTHRRFMEDTKIRVMDADMRRGDRHILISPLFHIAGNNYIRASIYSAGCDIIFKNFDAGATLQTIDRERATHLEVVPTHLIAMLNQPDFDKYDLSSLKVIWYAASPMPLEVLKRGIKTFGNIFCQGFGQTESGPSIAFLSREDHEIRDDIDARYNKLISAGQPDIGVHVRIVDEDNNDLPAGEVGEIIVESNQRMAEFWKKPEDTAKSIVDGWLHTGDMGYYDESGYIYIADRKRDMIISGGENVFPREVENILYTHPAVMEAAVIGLPDPYWVEKVHAAVVLKKSAKATDKEIMDFCKKSLAGYKVPKSIDFVDELPKNPTGKILKRVMREQYLEKSK